MQVQSFDYWFTRFIHQEREKTANFCAVHSCLAVLQIVKKTVPGSVDILEPSAETQQKANDDCLKWAIC